MSYINKLKESIILLSEAGEKELASDLMCAFAALTGSISPRIDLTYSSVSRELRKKDKDILKNFQKEFKSAFEDALDEDIENPEKIALMQALQIIDVEI